MTGEIICATCGRAHPITDSELTFGLPDVVVAMSEDERKSRCKIGNEIVALNDSIFFLRGLLSLNVSGREREYNLGVWVEVARDILDRIDDLWSDPNQHQEPRMPAKLANKIPFHSNTVGLLVSIQLTGPKTRPKFFIEPTEHSLYNEQARGVSEHRAIEYSDPNTRKSAIEQTLQATRETRALEGQR